MLFKNVWKIKGRFSVTGLRKGGRDCGKGIAVPGGSATNEFKGREKVEAEKALAKQE